MRKIVKAIYDAPVVFEIYGARSFTVAIKYQQKTYAGYAICHPDEQDFFSVRVGKNIALSRARQKAMKDALVQAREEVKYRQDLWHEAVGRAGGDYNLADPTRAFMKSIHRSQDKVFALQQGLKRERANLRNYIEGQDRAIESVKIYRDKLKGQEEVIT